MSNALLAKVCNAFDGFSSLWFLLDQHLYSGLLENDSLSPPRELQECLLHILVEPLIYTELPLHMVGTL